MSGKLLHVLGTASQVPTRKRNHNGYLLNWASHGLTPYGFLFDPGEATQRQMIFAGQTCAGIDKIFISHFHGDHCLGLPGMIQGIVNSTKDFEKTLEIYYPASGENFFNNLRYACAYKTHKLNIVPVPITTAGIVYEDKCIVISAQFLKHRMPTLGYRIEEKPKRTMFGEKLKQAGIFGKNVNRLLSEGKLTIDDKVFLLDDFSEINSGHSFAFVMDTVPCANAVVLANSVDLLVCESTYLSADEADAGQNGHMTAAQAAFIAKTSGAKKLVLTHFSQRYNDTDLFAAEAKPIFENVIAARDWDVIPVS